jgi:hypothetical protein
MYWFALDRHFDAIQTLSRESPGSTDVPAR